MCLCFSDASGSWWMTKLTAKAVPFASRPRKGRENTHGHVCVCLVIAEHGRTCANKETNTTGNLSGVTASIIYTHINTNTNIKKGFFLVSLWLSLLNLRLGLSRLPFSPPSATPHRQCAPAHLAASPTPCCARPSVYVPWMATSSPALAHSHPQP
jgi:hypothetical protein